MDNGVVSNEGIKRRLPPWMLGDQARIKSETLSSSTCDEDDDGIGADEERVKKRGRRPKSKACEIGNDDGGLELEKESSGVLRRCRERKQTRREMVSHYLDINGEVAINKKKRGGRAKKSLDVNDNEEFEGYVENGEDDDLTMEDLMSIAKEVSHDLDIHGEVAIDKKKRKGRAKKSFDVNDKEKFECHAENGEDEDLTMEDLMSIAKEFVKEDEDAQPVVSSKPGHTARTQSQNTESGSSVSVPQGNIKSFEDRGTSSSIAVENLTSEVAACKPTMSGDPAQDMLDLFLGPLLKKTQEQEKECVLLPEEINFTDEVKKQPCSVVLGEEPAIVMKKKTSLKDKVALFLD